MKFIILDNWSLLITADNDTRIALTDAYHLGGYPRAEEMVHEALCATQIIPGYSPAMIFGALTDSPMITADADYPDGDGPIPRDDVPVWWFPGYELTDPWEVLKMTGRVVFTRAF